MTTSRRILITGGCGFLGFNIREHLLELGMEVTVLDRLPLEEARAKLPGLKEESYVNRDLRAGVAELVEVVKDHDLIVHLAATSNTLEAKENFIIDLENSLRATWELAEAVKRSEKRPHIIFTSSQHVYGFSASSSDLKNRELLPVSSYGAAKVGAESVLCAYAMQGDLTCTVLRLSNMIGTRENYGVLVDFIRRLKADPNRLEIWGDGSQTRNFLHVGDLSHLVEILVQEEEFPNFRAYDVGNTGSLSVLEMAKILLDVTGLPECELTVQKASQFGWNGDPGTIHLKERELLSLGWTPALDVQEAVRKAAAELWEEVE